MTPMRTESHRGSQGSDTLGQGNTEAIPSREGDVVALRQMMESFLLFPERALLCRANRPLGSLKQLGFSLEERGRTLRCRFRLQSRRVVRRVVAMRRRDEGSVAVRMERFKRPEWFEIRWGGRSTEEFEVGSDAHQFGEAVERIILRNFPGARIQNVSRACDRAHSLSGKYVRVRFATGQNSWAAVAVSPWEDQATVNQILSDGLIWREVLRSRGHFSENLLFLVPEARCSAVRSRLAWIRGGGRALHLMAMDLSGESLRFLDPECEDPTDSRLPPAPGVLPAETRIDRDRLRRVLALAPQLIEPSLNSTSSWISLRIHGLEFARMSLEDLPKVTFGIEKDRPLETAADWQDLGSLVRALCRQRRPGPVSKKPPYYRLQAERWLESLILKDIQRIDARLDNGHVYSQVPTFEGGSRGVIDILTVSAVGRLAVLELKAAEDIELPMQGLDYWLRVRWHQLKQDFSSKGYFPGVSLSSTPPLLYFVSPQFCYHSTFPLLAHSLRRAVPMVQVGLNENWRQGIQVVSKREFNLGS